MLRRFRAALLQSRLLLVKGVVQREGLVVHIVAGEARDLSHKLAALTALGGDLERTRSGVSGDAGDFAPAIQAFRARNFH